jgi:hypothetical protein
MIKKKKDFYFMKFFLIEKHKYTLNKKLVNLKKKIILILFIYNIKRLKRKI